jgi:hypothetical protein
LPIYEKSRIVEYIYNNSIHKSAYDMPLKIAIATRLSVSGQAAA